MAKEWDRWVVGLGVGYVWRGEYDFATNIRDYDPGDIFTATGGAIRILSFVERTCFRTICQVRGERSEGPFCLSGGRFFHGWRRPSILSKIVGCSFYRAIYLPIQSELPTLPIPETILTETNGSAIFCFVISGVNPRRFVSG